MVERLLCEDGVKVVLIGSGDRLILVIEGENAVSFGANADDFAEAIDSGTPLQLSTPGAYCRLTVVGARVHLDFAVGSSGRRSCDFPLVDLIESLATGRNC